MTTEMVNEDLDIETSDSDLVLNAVKTAIELLDRALDETRSRGIVSATEMSDFLLDVRLVLAPLVV